MVWGMLQSLMGSFIIVFIMMAILFRSPLWGLVCMVPLSITIAVIYGIIGLVGKDYDMPVAVLSALTLGMAVDFAIHFTVRMRHLYSRRRDWQASLEEFFREPAQAILRNLLVVAEMCADFGKRMDVGNIPDPFGHISQLPQVLRGFDIDSVVFTRGVSGVRATASMRACA